jgi:hypothetical protein
VELLGIAVVVVAVGLILWILDCNTKTNIDTMRCLANLLKAVSSQEITYEQCNVYLTELESVPHQSYVLRLVTLRDPKQLYSSGLAKFF